MIVLRYPIRISLTALFVFMLNGCTLFTPATSQLSWQAQSQQLSMITNWQTKARIAMRSNGEAYTATLLWTQQTDHLELTIYAVLGQTVAHLYQDQTGARLDIPDEPSRYGDNAQQLLYEAIGWDLPIHQLTHWIRGMQGSEDEKITFDQQGFIRTLGINDWLVNYKTYDLYDTFWLPEKITVQHPNLTLKIAVNQWTFNR